MKELIRSPLQFVRPMSEQEWEEMKLRAKNREIRRERRRRARQKLAPIVASSQRRDSLRAAQAADSSGVF